MGTSLIAGWFPEALIVAALASVAVSVRCWGLSSRRVAAAAAFTVAATLGAWVAATSSRLVVPALPLIAYGWVTPFAFALGLLVSGAGPGRRRHRVVSAVAVVLTAAMAANLFNTYYAYYPTLRSLVGAPTAHEVSPAQLAAMQKASATALTLPASMPPHGVTFQVAIPGVVSRFHARNAWVYLPPAWFARPRPPLPVVMLLEGTPAEPVDWFRAGLADRTADRFALRHHGMAPILVLPDQNGSFLGDTECVNRPGVRPEDYLAVDVRNFVIARYGAPSNPSAWAVAGLSAGGTCAFDLALRHSNLFRMFGDFSGDAVPSLPTPRQTVKVLFGGSADARRKFEPPWLLNQRPRRRRMAAFFEAGRDDRKRLGVDHRLARLAAHSGIHTRWATTPGAHSYVVWSASFHSALDFFWPQFKIAPGTNEPRVRPPAVRLASVTAAAGHPTPDLEGPATTARPSR